MPRNEAKPKSVRKPLRDLSNNNNNEAGKLSKSTNSKKKCSDETSDNDNSASLDRLLLVHSDLSALLHQIDELVVQALKVKTTTKHGSKEIESFTGVLSGMLSTLKPWVPRFQNVVSSPVKSVNQLGLSLPSKPSSNENGEGKSEFGSPEGLKEDTLISPSPLVSWRANCTIERSRQLFLLTPLPMSKAFSSKYRGTSQSVLERINFNQTVQLPPLLTIPGDANDDLLEGVAIQPTPRKSSDSIATITANTLESGVVTSPMLSKRDNSVLVTPCLKMSPPKSCVLLEPISESSHRPINRIHKSTPFPVGIQNCQDSPSSDSSSSEDSNDLAFKYPELLGIRQACKLGTVKKELESSPDWLFSPPKSCVLLEPLDDKSQENAAVDLQTITSPSNKKENNAHTGCHQLKTSCHPEPVRKSNLSFIESTPLWKEPESSFRTGKRPGENTLKKELWTKFEAASTLGIRHNASVFQKTARKGFLDMLEEASCDDEGSVLDGLR